MSAPESTVCAPTSLPAKPELKPRPPLPSKAIPDPPPIERGTATRKSGKVKKIVKKFDQPEPAQAQVSAPVTGTGSAGTNGSVGSNGSTGMDKTGLQRQAPEVLPKPRVLKGPQPKGDQAPPLPMKRSRLRKTSNVGAYGDTPGARARNGSTTANVEVSRSAPDGKEGELLSAASLEMEAEKALDKDALPSPRCERICSCICHLKRPGMKLVWVPLEDGEQEEEEEEEEGEKVSRSRQGAPGVEEEEERGGEGKSEAGEQEEPAEEEEGGLEAKLNEGEDEDDEEEVELYLSESSDDSDSGGELTGKAKFQHTLELVGEQLRRRSDPGPQVVLTSYTPHNPNSLSPGGMAKAYSMEADSDIYELNIVVNPVPPPRLSEPQVPAIRIKPPRRSKLSSTASDEADGADLAKDRPPPAIPPRVPLLPERPKNTRLGMAPIGGIALPQPSPEDRRVFRSASPLPSHASPPPSPRPHRAPPPIPKQGQNGFGGSNLSLNSLPPSIEVEEKKGEGKEDAAMDKPPAAPPRKKSIDWDSMDEPLYQTYRETVIIRAIRQATVCRNISKASVDFQMDYGHRRGSGASSIGGVSSGSLSSRASPIPEVGQSTLWRDLPGVRESGILETLNSDQCKYQESMFEVLTSEVSYLRSLRVLTEHFMDSRELQDTLINRDKVPLFSNIVRILEVSERFLKDLEDRMEESLIIADICDIIHYHAQHNFPAYIDYVRNQIYQEKTYSSLMQSNTAFAAAIMRLQESPRCQRLPFMSFLLLPFQRITRIKMLIENILKRTKEHTPEEQTASKALASVSKIIDECNTQVGKMKQMEELIEINNMLEFDKLKALPIISQTRFLEKRGELQDVAKGGTFFTLRSKLTPVFLFLFNDLLVITSKKSSERYVVLDYAHRSLVQVKTLRPDELSGGGLDHCFILTLLENHQGRLNERMLKAATESEMHRWVAAFPNPNAADRDAEEVIYEDWDCPQVQCKDQYVAQQADEITLEPTEIVNVIRKTNEGWYEGIRLSDGQKGWFPVANVVEITNEHVRRRNLRERYRVMQAASMGTGKSRVTL